MARLTDRASLLRSLFRLLDTDAEDGTMIEHDIVTLEGAYIALQQGLADAQSYLFSADGGSWWLAVSDALAFTQEDDGRQWATLPDGFRRMYSVPDRSALHTLVGAAWGTEITPDLQWSSSSSNSFFIANDRLWLTRGASPPSDLRMDYYRLAAKLADDSDADFPEEDRGLIVAYAADLAMEEHWFTGGPEGVARIQRNLQKRKTTASKRARRTSAPKKVGTPLVMDHWWA